MEQDFTRMKDRAREPTEQEIMGFIGERATESWIEIKRFIEDHYDITPETIFYGAKYGWTIRYRKSGKTLCSLFPERGAFTVLVVLGRKESEKSLSIRDELSGKVNRLMGNAEQLHDGRWLWIRVLATSDADDIKKLLTIKEKTEKDLGPSLC